MIKQQANSQKVKVQPEEDYSERNFNMSAENKESKQKEAKTKKLIIKKPRRWKLPVLKFTLIQQKLFFLVEEGKTIQEAVNILEKKINLNAANRFMARVKKDKKLRSSVSLRKDIIQKEKCQELLKPQSFCNFDKTKVNFSHLVMNGLIKKEDYKAQMNLFCLAELVQARSKMLPTQEAKKMALPLYKAHNIPKIEMPRFMKSPAIQQCSMDSGVDVKVQE